MTVTTQPAIDPQKPKPSLGAKVMSRIKTARFGMSVVIFLAVLMMGMRIQDVANGLMHGRNVAGVTPAQAEGGSKTSEGAAKEADKPAAHEEAKKEEPKKEGEAAKDEKPDPINTDPVNPAEQENYTDAEVNILKRLSERRQELDKLARDIDQREALLKITEQRIDKKLGDMKTMQEQLRQTVATASAEQKAKTDSMVKIYEIMKPKEAARIFDALDMPILMDVISHMKEARVAPILAAMDSQKAKQVTSALMEKRPLPNVP